MSESMETVPANAISFLCHGLREAGVSLVTNHPGFRSNELAAAFHREAMVTSANEKTALAVAWGHALGGRRAAFTFKNVGLNDAADPFVNALQLGVHAGLVGIVFDDTDLEHSQMWMDARHYLPYGGIWLEPSNLREASRFCSLAFEVSETLGVPVVVRVTNALLSRGGAGVEVREPPAARSALPMARDPRRWVAHPANASARADELRARRTKILEWCDQFTRALSPEARAGTIRHFIFGSANAVDAGTPAHTMRLPCLPVSEGLIACYAEPGAPLRVSEHGDPVVARAISAALCSVPVLAEKTGSRHPNRAYHCRDELAPVYAYLRSLPSAFLVGDLGGHLMDSARSVDACLCYGASVATAAGYALARPEASVSCVCGDGAFLHSGKAAVSEAMARGVQMLVVVIDNGGCQGTGGQRPPGELSMHLPEIPERSAVYSPGRPGQALTCLDELAALPQPVRILHLKTNF